MLYLLFWVSRHAFQSAGEERQFWVRELCNRIVEQQKSGPSCGTCFLCWDSAVTHHQDSSSRRECSLAHGVYNSHTASRVFFSHCEQLRALCSYNKQSRQWCHKFVIVWRDLGHEDDCGKTSLCEHYFSLNCISLARRGACTTLRIASVKSTSVIQAYQNLHSLSSKLNNWTAKPLISWFILNVSTQDPFWSSEAQE